jgi:phosphoglycolate phosphatase-like HAD superfamily hydrolase
MPDRSASLSPPSRIVSRLILFDVDGTLVLTGGAGSRAMTLAFRDIFGVDEAFAGVPMPGRTDQLILADALERAGVTSEASAIEGFRSRYLEHLAEQIVTPAPGKFKGVLPGVQALLGTLSRRQDVFLALLTGNYSDAARVKLEHFDLWRYFGCGAFGEDASERNALVPIAVSRARGCGLPELPPQRIVVIGDTPLDVACAHAAGARAIAVANGLSDLETLRRAGADAVFEDLSDTLTVIKTIERLTT